MSYLKSKLVTKITKEEDLVDFYSTGQRYSAVAVFRDQVPKLMFEVQKAAAHVLAVPFAVVYKDNVEDPEMLHKMLDVKDDGDDYSVVVLDREGKKVAALRLDSQQPDRKFRAVKRFVASAMSGPVDRLATMEDLDSVMGGEDEERIHIIIFFLVRHFFHIMQNKH